MLISLEQFIRTIKSQNNFWNKSRLVKYWRFQSYRNNCSNKNADYYPEQKHFSGIFHKLADRLFSNDEASNIGQLKSWVIAVICSSTLVLGLFWKNTILEIEAKFRYVYRLKSFQDFLIKLDMKPSTVKSRVLTRLV